MCETRRRRGTRDDEVSSTRPSVHKYSAGTSEFVLGRRSEAAVMLVSKPTARAVLTMLICEPTASCPCTLLGNNPPPNGCKKQFISTISKLVRTSVRNMHVLGPSSSALVSIPNSYRFVTIKRSRLVEREARILCDPFAISSSMRSPLVHLPVQR